MMGRPTKPQAISCQDKAYTSVPNMAKITPKLHKLSFPQMCES